jgi:hypothetical protein
LTKHLPVTRSRQNPFRDSKNKVDRAGAPTCQWQVMTVMWWTLEIYDLWPDMIRPVAHHGWKAPWATRREHSILRDWASRFQPAPSRPHEKVSLDGRAPQSNTNFANVRFISKKCIIYHNFNNFVTVTVQLPRLVSKKAHPERVAPEAEVMTLWGARWAAASQRYSVMTHDIKRSLWVTHSSPHSASHISISSCRARPISPKSNSRIERIAWIEGLNPALLRWHAVPGSCYR